MSVPQATSKIYDMFRDQGLDLRKFLVKIELSNFDSKLSLMSYYGLITPNQDKIMRIYVI